MFFLQFNSRCGTIRLLALIALATVCLMGSVLRPVAGDEKLRLVKEIQLDPADIPFHKVSRGDVRVTIEERGSVESMDNGPVACQIDNAVIKWLIDNGAAVKKGDKVVELESAALTEQMRLQEVVVAQKKSQLDVATAEKELAVKLGSLEVEETAAKVASAEIGLKQAAENERAKLEIQLKVASLGLEAAKLSTSNRTEKAEAEIAPRKAALEAEMAKLNDLKTQLAACVLTAPRDGIAVYDERGAARFGERVTAVGETMKRGQCVLKVPDLKRMKVVVSIPDRFVTQLRPMRENAKTEDAQPVTIVVDAFQGKLLKGRVQAVAAVADQPSFFSSDTKVYSTTILFEPKQEIPELKPGMSVAVSILVEDRKNVLRVPVQTIMAKGADRFCYVKTADGFERRRVVVGRSNDIYAEIKEGLKEGESVALNPRQLDVSTRKIMLREEKSVADIVARSVRLDDGGRRARVDRYGLSDIDLRLIEATVPDLALAVPSRTINRDAKSPSTGRIDPSAHMVATTADYAVIHGLSGQLTDEEHRFLCDHDQENSAAVAVIGARIARKLFPLDDPLGQTIVLNSRSFRIVGVLKEGADADREEDVYIPLASCRRLFGKMIATRKLGAVRIEEVELDAIELIVVARDRTEAVQESVREILEHSHDRNDWEIAKPSIAPR
jgi:HlyD family secretion protein